MPVARKMWQPIASAMPAAVARRRIMRQDRAVPSASRIARSLCAGELCDRRTEFQGLRFCTDHIVFCTRSVRLTAQPHSEEINMPTLNDLIDGDVQQLDTGFTFTEGPLYHPDGFYYFVDVRESKFYRIKPGEKA